MCLSKLFDQILEHLGSRLVIKNSSVPVNGLIPFAQELHRTTGHVQFNSFTVKFRFYALGHCQFGIIFLRFLTTNYRCKLAKQVPPYNLDTNSAKNLDSEFQKYFFAKNLVKILRKAVRRLIFLLIREHSIFAKQISVLLQNSEMVGDSLESR